VFGRATGLVVDEVSGSHVTGHIELGPSHHTPWGIVHGGVYSTAVESAPSIGASLAVRDVGQVAVGITNTTHFLRSLTAGRVLVDVAALNQGRSQQLWRVDTRDESGRLVTRWRGAPAEHHDGAVSIRGRRSRVRPPTGPGAA